MESKNPNSNILDYILNSVIIAANKADIFIWLEAGTLLGMVRTKDYIPWESDLDFGVYDDNITEDKINKLKLSLAKRKLNVTAHNTYINIEFPKSKCCADINICKKYMDYSIVELYGPGSSLIAKLFRYMLSIIEGKIIEKDNCRPRIKDRIKQFLTMFYSFLPKYISNMLAIPVKKLYENYFIKDLSWKVPNYLLSSFEEFTFRGIKVSVPKLKEEYLSYRYGRDWKIPRKNYKPWKDDGVIVNKTVYKLRSRK